MANIIRSRYSDVTNSRIENVSCIMNRLLKLLVGAGLVLTVIFALLHLGTERHPRAIAVNEPPMECEDTPEITNNCVNDEDTDAAPELTPADTPG